MTCCICAAKAIPGRTTKSAMKRYNNTSEELMTVSEWCNSFVVVPKANSKVRLCLDPVQLNQVLLIPVHRGPTLNGILPKLPIHKHTIPVTHRCHLQVP